MESTSSSSDSFDLNLKGQHLVLMADKTMYWKEQRMLIISDLHIGKVMHFRKHGYAVPIEAIRQNWERLSTRLLNLDITSCLFLGDLFHSTENSETDMFWGIINQFPSIHFILVKGNHDVHSANYFKQKGLEVHETLSINPFVFTHEPLEKTHSLYNISGHIHPSIRLKGKARSFLKLACFFIQNRQAILPAFGVFTGSHSIKPQKEDLVIAILDEDTVMEIKVERLNK